MAEEHPAREGHEALVESPQPDTSVRKTDARKNPREFLHKAAGFAKRRGTAAAMSAAMFLSLHSDSGPKIQPDTTPRPPGVEQSAVPPGSLDAVVADLEQNSSVNKNETVTDLSSLQKPGDTYEVFRDTEGEIVLKDIDTEPLATKQLLTITYDDATKAFQPKDSALQNEDPNVSFHILHPLIDNVVLKTAFANGELDEIVVRLYEPPNDSNITQLEDGKAIITQVGAQYKEEGVGEKGIKKLYLFLPQKLNAVDLDYAATHEGLHGIEQSSLLSGVRKAEELKNTTEDEKWRSVCESVRTIAIDQAEQQSHELLKTMEENYDIFSDPNTRKIFEDVHDALQSGDFNRFQPTYSEQDSDYQTVLKECKTLGPATVFNQLLELRAESEKFAPIQGSEKDKIIKLLIDMGQQWDDILKYKTIYEQLREGYYIDQKGGKNTNAGQPQTDWGEGIVSATNLVIQDPETLARTVAMMSDSERDATLAYIDASVHTMDSLLPGKENDEFHILLRMNYNYFRQIAATS